MSRFNLGRWLGALGALALAVSGSVAQAGGKMPVQWDKSHAGEAIDLGKAAPVFDESFAGPSRLNGPKLFAAGHSPFGAGVFDPPGGPAYQASPGQLTLRAYRQDGRWRSGLVQTVDAKGNGFTCQGCYFEAKLRMPPGRTFGFWGAFWLLSVDKPGQGHVEVDALEWYGSSSMHHHHAVHVWKGGKDGHAYKSEITTALQLMDGGWHTYGVLQRPGLIIVYLDRREVSRVAVDESFNQPLYMLANLAVLQPEQDRATDGMSMDVGYLRAYRLR